MASSSGCRNTVLHRSTLATRCFTSMTPVTRTPHSQDDSMSTVVDICQPSAVVTDMSTVVDNAKGARAMDSEQAGAPPGRRDAGATRTRLLEAARELFLARGYSAIGLREVAAK